jgi:hypothetical protein
MAASALELSTSKVTIARYCMVRGKHQTRLFGSTCFPKSVAAERLYEKLSKTVSSVVSAITAPKVVQRFFAASLISLANNK